MLKELVTIANELDRRGLTKEADLLDKIAVWPLGSVDMAPESSPITPWGRFGPMKLVDVVREVTSTEISGAWGNVHSPSDLFLAKPWQRPGGGALGRTETRAGLDPEGTLASQWDDLDEYGGAGIAIKEAVLERNATERAPAEEPMMAQMAPRSGEDPDIARIQLLVGAYDDGRWGPDTIGKVKEFLEDREEYLLPVGSSAEDVLEKGQSLFSVRGSDTDSYAPNWGGLLNLLIDVDAQRGRLMASLDNLRNTEVAQTSNVTEFDLEDPDTETLGGPRTVSGIIPGER